MCERGVGGAEEDAREVVNFEISGLVSLLFFTSF